MSNPSAVAGYASLTTNDDGDFSLTSAATYVGQAVEGFEAFRTLSVQFVFTYGSGTSSGVAYLQTSLDGGTVWGDIAAVSLATSSFTRWMTLDVTKSTSSATPGDGALGGGNVVEGFLGDRLRVKVVTNAAYTNTVLAVKVRAK